jgi:ribosomal protein S27AE
MSGGGSVPEAAQEEKRVPDLECHRCGATAVVTRGDMDLCGPCYYSETVKERRRTQGRRRPGGDAAFAVIEEIERALFDQLERESCDCGKTGLRP